MAFKDFFRFDTAAGEDWPQRPVVLASLGGGAGLIIHLLTRAGTEGPAVAMRGATVLFVGLVAILVAFTFERTRSRWSAVFAFGAAAFVAMVSLILGGPLAWWDELWRLVCIILAVAIAAPLFQAARDEGRAVFPYRQVHDHAWTNVLLGAASVSFTGIVFAVLFLLAALFRLIGIELPWNVVSAPWFGWTLGGAAALGAVGWLRERVGVMRGTIGILALLAPVMGAGLAIFLLSIPFTGLAPLWEATRSTTPILLGCIAGGLVIANAVIGAEDEDAKPGPMLWGALAITVSLLPLALIAVASVAARIGQYGLLPERLWAVVFVGIASAYGLGYLVAVLRGRRAWPAHVRDANLRLSFALGALALFLSLPILNFNAISARDQVARLEQGEVTADRFDYAALRFAMGEPGRAQLAALARSANVDVRARATQAARADNRWAVNDLTPDEVRGSLRVLPRSIPLPAALAEAVADLSRRDGGRAVLIYETGAGEAFHVSASCRGCPAGVVRVALQPDGTWEEAGSFVTPRGSTARLEDAQVEIRRVPRRQVFVNGQPAGPAFE